MSPFLPVSVNSVINFFALNFLRFAIRFGGIFSMNFYCKNSFERYESTAKQVYQQKFPSWLGLRNKMVL